MLRLPFDRLRARAQHKLRKNQRPRSIGARLPKNGLQICGLIFFFVCLDTGQTSGAFPITIGMSRHVGMNQNPDRYRGKASEKFAEIYAFFHPELRSYPDAYRVRIAKLLRTGHAEMIC